MQKAVSERLSMGGKDPVPRDQILNCVPSQGNEWDIQDHYK